MWDCDVWDEGQSNEWVTKKDQKLLDKTIPIQIDFFDQVWNDNFSFKYRVVMFEMKGRPMSGHKGLKTFR